MRSALSACSERGQRVPRPPISLANRLVDASAEVSDWQVAADKRIRKYRTADLTIAVSDADGGDVNGGRVAVEMKEHDFGFETAVNACMLIEETEESDNYRTYLSELFNKAVLENQYKWRFSESDLELTNAATDCILDRGLDLRGHVCLWANMGAWAVPQTS